MSSRFSIIVSFLLVSLLAVGGVELFYRTLENKLQQMSGEAVMAPVKKKKEKLPPPAKVEKPAPSSIPVQEASITTGKRDYSIISKRQLFGKKQKEQEITPEPAPVLTTTSLDLTLLGTISGEGDVQRAIIMDKKARTQDLYYNGDAIGPALIKKVERGKVILTIDGKDEVLLMQEPKSIQAKGGSSTQPDNLSAVMEQYINLPEEEPEEEAVGEEVPAEVVTEEAISTPPIAEKSRSRKMTFKRQNQQENDQ